MNRLSHYFINGLIVLVPIAITYFVIATIFTIIEGIVESYIPLKFPGAGVALLLIMILVAGWITSTWTWASQKIISYFESVVDKIPVVKFIYNSVKRVSTMLFESKTMFSQVVLIPYPHPGVKTIGFFNAQTVERDSSVPEPRRRIRVGISAVEPQYDLRF